MRIKIADLSNVKKYAKQPRSKDKLISNYSGIKTNWTTNETTQERIYVQDDLAGPYFHANYLEYLETAWANHFGIVLTPDIMWHTLLSEVVSIVAETPAGYAELFTSTPGKKKEIVVQSNSLTEMPLDVLISAIKPLVPTNADLFLPEFTTTTLRARFARYASFADLVSPYYSYSMFCCGIPYVDLQGTDEDWRKVENGWIELGHLIKGQEMFFIKVLSILDAICRKTIDWSTIFSMQRCGSGGQVEASGWWTDLYRVQPQSPRFAYNFATHLAKVSYKQLNTNMDYEMYHGLLQSRLEDDCLVPDFGSIVYRRPEKPVVTSAK